jgi:hypothetical protein
MPEHYAHLVPLSSVLKVYRSKDDYLQKAQYQSVVSVTYNADDSVTLSAANGTMVKDSIDAIESSLIRAGVNVAELDRADGHTFPYGDVLYEKDGLVRYRWILGSGFKPARFTQANRSKGESMKALADSNIGTNVTEIKDKDGNLLIKFTREYGVAVSTAEVIAIEAALVELAAKLQAA